MQFKATGVIMEIEERAKTKAAAAFTGEITFWGYCPIDSGLGACLSRLASTGEGKVTPVADALFTATLPPA